MISKAIRLLEVCYSSSRYTKLTVDTQGSTNEYQRHPPARPIPLPGT